MTTKMTHADKDREILELTRRLAASEKNAKDPEALIKRACDEAFEYRREQGNTEEWCRDGMIDFLAMLFPGYSSFVRECCESVDRQKIRVIIEAYVGIADYSTPEKWEGVEFIEHAVGASEAIDVSVTLEEL